MPDITLMQMTRSFLAACDLPDTATNQLAWMALHANEYGTAEPGGPVEIAAWNPWDTTEPWAGATDFNSVGVKNYLSAADGIAATRATLLAGRYDDAVVQMRLSAGPTSVGKAQSILRALMAAGWGTINLALVPEVLGGWSTYGNLIVGRGAPPVPVPEPSNPIPRRKEDDVYHTSTYSTGGKYAVRGFRKTALSNPALDEAFQAANPETTPVSLTDVQLDLLQEVPADQL